MEEVALEVFRYVNTLGGETEETLIGISFGTQGANSVGANDGSGHATNPATGMSHGAKKFCWPTMGERLTNSGLMVLTPRTPPRHWNTFGISASDQLREGSFRSAGEGFALSRLEWDLRLFLSLNAPLHQAAVSTCGSKRSYGDVRLVAMIGYLGSRGELPVEAEVVELAADQTTVSGGRHQRLPGGDGGADLAGFSS